MKAEVTKMKKKTTHTSLCLNRIKIDNYLCVSSFHICDLSLHYIMYYSQWSHGQMKLLPKKKSFSRFYFYFYKQAHSCADCAHYMHNELLFPFKDDMALFANYVHSNATTNLNSNIGRLC